MFVYDVSHVQSNHKRSVGAWEGAVSPKILLASLWRVCAPQKIFTGFITKKQFEHNGIYT